MDQEAGGPPEKARLMRTLRIWERSIPVLVLGPAILLLSASLLSQQTRSGAEPGISDLGKPTAVKRVIDGDTIELASGERVRYLGIDAPELRRKVLGRWVEAPEPFAVEAYQLNRHLVEGRSVRLEVDREPRDHYNRLLAYVFVDHRLVNAELISSGYVIVRIHPPNLRYADLFMKLQTEARAHKRGLWAIRDDVDKKEGMTHGSTEPVEKHVE